MASKNFHRRSPSRRHDKQSRSAESDLTGELRVEIKRLKTLLRDPLATRQQKAKVRLQIAEYQEIAGMVLAAPPDWLLQMQLLGE